MLQTGDLVDDFAAPDETGTVRRLSEELREGPVVLFFYPRAMTRGCTAESCHFRDLGAEFSRLGASRLGISADPVSRQAAFAAKEGLDYPLLSDPDRAIARSFGVRRPGPLFNRRATFVIDTDHRILAAIASEVDMNRHADQAIQALEARPQPPG